MTNEQAYVTLENCASLLYSGTRFFPENHVKQFHEAYELAMKALRKTERKRGRWKETDDGWNGTHYVCSECGCPWTLIDGTPEDNSMNYCPNCGADMREGEQE